MLLVTDEAKQALKYVLTNNEDKSFSVFRLVSNGPTNYTLEGATEELPGDEIIETDGMKLLLIDKEFAASLQEVVIDFVNTPEGARLIIDFNSPEGSSCCGQSDCTDANCDCNETDCGCDDPECK
ncbi:MAG: hypothetical protein NTV30_01835 [Chloroflexi bacterium]|nr:hypothetical protein [Chloroflexota bacterium]